MVASHGGRRSASGGDFELQIGIAAAAFGGDDGFELRLFGSELVEIRIFLRIGSVHLVEALLRGQYAAQPLFDCLAHVLGRLHVRLLGQIADFQVGHGRGRRQ